MTTDADSAAGTDATAEVLRVDWDDPRAVALRAAMDEEIGPRYASRQAEATPEHLAEIGRALHLDPADVVAVLLVVADGVPVAHAALRRLRDEWELKRVVTLIEHRGRGYSRLLIAAVEDEVRARGARRLILQTGDQQPEAIRLYERYGFERIPVYEPYTVVPVSLCFAKDV